jgi:hypothetical protein
MGSFVSLGAPSAILQQQIEIYAQIQHLVDFNPKNIKDENLYERCLDSMSLLLKLNDSMRFNIDVQHPFDYLDKLNFNEFKLEMENIQKCLMEKMNSTDDWVFEEIKAMEIKMLQPVTMFILCFIDFYNDELSFEKLKYIFNKWMN